MVEICHHYAEPITTHRTEKKILIIYLPLHCNMALTRKALPFPLFASQHEMKLARWRQMAQQPTADWLKYFVHVGKFRTSILIGSGQNTLQLWLSRTAIYPLWGQRVRSTGQEGHVIVWHMGCLLYALSMRHMACGELWDRYQNLEFNMLSELNKWAKSYLEHN